MNNIKMNIIEFYKIIVDEKSTVNYLQIHNLFRDDSKTSNR